MNTYIQVQITFPSNESAEKIAEKLVRNHLVACAQLIGPIRSHYIWQGQAERSNEILLLAKMRLEFLDRLIESVKEDHPYECPQIVALPIVAGSEDYLTWLGEMSEPDTNHVSSC